MSQKNEGFTTIELLITLFVGFAFIATFFQLFTIIDQGVTESRWQSTASNLAYSNLRQFSARPGTFDCSGSSTTTLTNLTIRRWAPGQLIYNPTPGDYDGLPGTVRQEVRAYAPAGCGPDMPIKLQSIVYYGDDKQVRHATYVN